MTYVHEESINDVQDALVKSSTLIPNDSDVSKDDISDSEHILVESSMLVQVARYSLFISMIEDRTEQEIVDTNVITSGKSSDFSCVDCDYVVALYFFSSSETVKFFTMAHQVTPNISFFSECLELFSNFRHISIGPNDVIPLAISVIRPPKKFIYLCLIFKSFT